MHELSTEVSNLKEMKVIIKAKLEGLVEGFVALGYYLKKTRDTNMFSEDGYENIYDFAKTEYNLSKSNVSRYMAINDRFSLEGNSLELAEEYKGFGSSKLSEMLTLSDEQMQIVTPETTREEIREYKKIINEIDSCAGATNTENTGAEGNLKEDKVSLSNLLDFYLKTEGRSCFEKIISIILTEEVEKETKVMYAMAPSKFKMIRFQGGTAICNAVNITIMRVGQAKEIFTYADFIKEIVEMFEPSLMESAKDTFKRYYQEDLVPPIPVKVEIKNVKEEKKEVKPKVVEEIDQEEEQIPGQVNINEIPEVIPDDLKEPFPDLEESEEIEEIVEITEDEPEDEAENEPEEELEDIQEPAEKVEAEVIQTEEESKEEANEVRTAAVVKETNEASVAAGMEETPKECHVEISGEFGNRFDKDKKLEEIKQFISQAMSESKTFTVDIKIIG